MPKTTRPKKTDGLFLRFEEKLGSEFAAACTADNLTQQDALRMAAEAMVRAKKELGRIPRDMDIRQRYIFTLDDSLRVLAEAVKLSRMHRDDAQNELTLISAVAEPQDKYHAQPGGPPLSPEEMAKEFGGPDAAKKRRPATTTKQGGA